MKKTFFVLGRTWLLTLFVGGCGSDGANASDSRTGGAAGNAGSDNAGAAGSVAGFGGSGGAAGAAGNAGSDSAGSGGASTWGIASRPTNQTCKPPASRNEQALLLSASGCVDPQNPKTPAATVIPYDVASPLWSDAAAKYRYFALSDTGKIRVKDCAREPGTCKSNDEGGTYPDEGDWDFPDGTVFIKVFELGGKLVETRLLMQIDKDNWWGYSYRWRDDQSDAELLPSNVEGHEKEVDGPNGKQTWHFPSRQQCLQCHTAAAGMSLGLETSQLNFDFTYPNGVRGNQIAQLSHIDAFEAAPALHPVFADPESAALPLEQRARSYLHSNCANCHRTGSTFPNFDISFDTPLKDTKLCNVAPEKGTMGVDDAMRLVPGAPDKSLVSLRMHTLDVNFRMPLTGTRVIDEAGVKLIDEWITSLESCP